MLSVITWRCDCGLDVKAMYETDGMTTVRCPDLQGKCKITHPIDGKVTHLWVENTTAAQQIWTPVPLGPFGMSSHTRLLLNEVVARWSELSLVDVDATNGNRERLVELLRAQHGFSQSCAAREI